MQNTFVAKKNVFFKMSDESEHSDDFFLLSWYPMPDYFNCQLNPKA